MMSFSYVIEKSPLAPSFDCAQDMLFQRGELKEFGFSIRLGLILLLAWSITGPVELSAAELTALTVISYPARPAKLPA